MIDKLHFTVVDTHWTNDDLRLRGLSLGFQCGTERFDEGWYFHFSQRGTKNIFIRRTYKGNKVECNPSDFGSHQVLMETFMGLFPDKFEKIMESKIQRLDLAVDMEMSLDDLMAGLEVPYLHRYGYWGYCRGVRTGFTSKPRGLSIYDKAIESKGELKKRRIEFHLDTKKLPDDLRLGGLHDFLIGQQFNPFKKLRHIDVGVFPLEEGASVKDIERHTRLKTLLSLQGYMCAKKILNLDRNFERDYGKFLSRSPSQLDLGSEYEKNILNYFGDPICGQASILMDSSILVEKEGESFEYAEK